MMLGFLVGFPFAAAAAVYLAGRRDNKDGDGGGRWAGIFAVTELLAALVCLGVSAAARGDTLTEWAVELPGFCGLGIGFTVDGFRALYTAVAAFMWAVSTLFSEEYMRSYRNRVRYYFFMLVTLGATVGIFLSADLFTTFIFFEIMSFASYVWVAQDEKKESLRAAETYLAVAVIGGLVLLMGLFLVYQGTGTLAIEGLWEACAQMPAGQRWAAGLCMLFGFAAKAGAFPLHIWLPKAHPVAPAPASALLSGILTKAGIFGILILSLRMFAGVDAWGALILGIGTVTMVLGAVLALFSVNLKRTLACSSISQIGFILVGTGAAVLLGQENDLAVKGSLLHMVNHSLIKLVLFSAAGVVFMNLHRLELNEIRGYGRKKPLLLALFLVGAVSIAGIPLGSGYASKTLLHEGLVEAAQTLGGAGGGALGIAGLSAGAGAVILKIVEWLFLISGGLTLSYMGKLFGALFIEKNEDPLRQEEFDRQKKYMNRITAVVLSVPAVFLFLMGILPGVIMDWMGNLSKGFLGHSQLFETINYYSWGNLQGALISMLIGCVVYFLVVRRWMMKDGRYVNRFNERIDLEERVYRPLLMTVLNTLFTVIFRFCDRLLDGLIVGLRRSAYRDSPLPHELEEGTVVTHVMGVIMDDGKEVLNHTVYRKHPLRVSLEHRLALLQIVLSENNTIIARSLSFGLLLFCIGLIVTLVYMLL